MAIRLPHYDKSEHARRGLEIYERQVRPQVEADHPGKIVAIDVDSMAYEVADDTLNACERLLVRHPEAQIWCVRIGPVAVHHFGPRIRAMSK